MQGLSIHRISLEVLDINSSWRWFEIQWDALKFEHSFQKLYVYMYILAVLASSLFHLTNYGYTEVPEMEFLHASF